MLPLFRSCRAYLDKLTRPSSAMMFDFATKCLADVSSEAAWAGQDYSDGQRYWTNEESLKMCDDNMSQVCMWTVIAMFFLRLVFPVSYVV